MLPLLWRLMPLLEIQGREAPLHPDKAPGRVAAGGTVVPALHGTALTDD